MDSNLIGLIAEEIKKSIGITVQGSLDLTSKRQGLLFWFENYNRSNGPVFSIRPSGLKRHTVSMTFGAYAAPCIEHIQNRASKDDYALAYAFTEQLNRYFDLKINESQNEGEWHISSSLKMSVTRKVADQLYVDDLFESVKLMMIPLIAAISELIGYENDTDNNEINDFDIEGGITQTLIQRRERSQRNRLLCFSLHGEKCGVCGFVTQDAYGEGVSSILEVHHIEPLSSLHQPKAYDPKIDLIPLCPNCHSAIHKRKPPFLPEDLKRMMNL
uniref:ORF25 n=1 Tax=Rheinheimera sp. BAL341 TaxID=1708203 RepID=A0A486XM85_9GAMM